MSNFKPFSEKVSERFKHLSKNKELFFLDVKGSDLWETYISSFPEGTNKMFREKRENDCNCCRSFIERYGNVVRLKNDGKYETLWDLKDLEEPWNTVAKSMKKFLNGREIKSVFTSEVTELGKFETNDFHNPDHKWYHFHHSLDSTFKNIDPIANANIAIQSKEELLRKIQKVDQSSMDLVIELIADGLYRGEENLEKLQNLKKFHLSYENSKCKNTFAWKNFNNMIYKMVESPIGILVQSMKEGKDLTDSVNEYGKMMDPNNYKRSKSVVTSSMVANASNKIEELNLEDSLARRFTKFSDISVNDVLFTARNVRTKMKQTSALEDLLKDDIKKTSVNVDPNDGEKINILDFMEYISKNPDNNLELHIPNSYKKRFVTLTSPVNKDAEKLFMWKNGFGWSYNGDITDSNIKELVSKAGGNVNVKLRVSLKWSSSSDLDIHIKLPSGERIYYGNKRDILDVDMNAGSVEDSKNPVENMSFKNPQTGKYEVHVHNYTKRIRRNDPFIVEMEHEGKIYNFTHSDDIRNNQNINVFNFDLDKNGNISIVNIHDNVTSESTPQEHWGIMTENFTPIDLIMNSPNYWEDSENVGQKHWFFMLKDCKSPNPVRGIFNEFLREDLRPHRKVFEILGSKMMCEPRENGKIVEQVAGVGFSSTNNDTALIKSGNKFFNVDFNNQIK